MSLGFIVANDRDRRGKPAHVGPNRADVKVSAADTDGRFALFEWEGRERGGPGLHVHDAQDEVFYVREGRYRFRLADDVHDLGPGDTIFLPRGIPHSFVQLSDHGKILYVLQPAGDMEAFFHDLATIDPATASEAEIVAVFARHGMRLVGPPEPLD